MRDAYNHYNTTKKNSKYWWSQVQDLQVKLCHCRMFLLTHSTSLFWTCWSLWTGGHFGAKRADLFSLVWIALHRALRLAPSVYVLLLGGHIKASSLRWVPEGKFNKKNEKKYCLFEQCTLLFSKHGVNVKPGKMECFYMLRQSVGIKRTQ